MKKPNPNSTLVKLTLLIVGTLVVMYATAISPALPAIEDHFADVKNVELLVKLVLTISALFVVIGALIAGFIIDRWGRKSVLVASTVLCGLAGSAGFVFDSLPIILVTRAVLGLAVAGVMTSVTTLIADYYTGRTRAQLMGYYTASLGFGAVIYLLLGGLLADFSWRAPFLMYLSAFGMLPFVLLVLHEPARLGASGHAKVLPAQGNGEPVNTVVPPVRLLALIFGIAFMTHVLFFLIPVQLPFYLEDLTNANAKESAFAIADFNLTSAFVALVFGQISTRLNVVTIVALGFGFMGVGYGVIGLADNYAHALIGLAIGGIGFGLVLPDLMVWLTAETPNRLRGRAIGGLTTFTFLGQFVSPFWSQPLSDQIGLDDTYIVACVIMLVLTVVFGWIRLRETVPIFGVTGKH